MRVAIGGFYHETNTFSASKTGLDNFLAYQFAMGQELTTRFRGTNSEIGGMIDALEEAGHHPVPLVFAAAIPSGVVVRTAFDHIMQEMLGFLRSAGPLDAVCLSLHGAASAEGFPDADGTLAGKVRETIGSGTRLAVTLDYHANIGHELIEAADFVTVYRTYPHTDMAERGREAIRVISSSVLPSHCAIRKIPMVTVPLVQATDDPPMRGVMARLDESLHRPAISSNSVAMGFAYADSPNLGATVLVYGNESRAVETEADMLACCLWDSREAFRPSLIPLRELPVRLASIENAPVVVVEPSDNIGGGSAGDGTEVLRCFIESGLGGVIQLADPAAAVTCRSLGTGGDFDMEIGARTDALHGTPVRLCGRVEWVGEVGFRNSGSYMTGFETSMGLTGVIRAGKLRVVVTSLRTMPFDTGVLTAAGIVPEEEKAIVVKSAVAWRAGFGQIAGRALIVDSPGICPANLANLDYRLADGSFWPLETDVTF